MMEAFKSRDIDLGSLKSTLKQFEGRNIGTPAAGSIHDVIIRSLIKGLDISVKNYPWADFIPDAILDDEIAAGVGTSSPETATSLPPE
jgi:NitT/TauT family transport system substrate-binding protein